MRAAPNGGHGYHTGPALFGRIDPVGEAQLDLVEVVADTPLHDAIGRGSEMQQDGLLEPAVDAPAAVAVRLGHPQLATLQALQAGIDLPTQFVVGRLGR